MSAELSERIADTQALVRAARTEMAKAVVGQAALVDGLLTGLITRGHILLEGVPGLAKTTAVKALARVVRADFRRIQFTPDLLPADLCGSEVLEPSTGRFRVRKGPIFHNIILADEINRAPSKVQSALLEAMQEGQATIGGETFPLPDPFLVLATQNPIEQEGVYPLPEAQTDRFMLKLTVDYPDREEEKEIVRRHFAGDAADMAPVFGPEDLADMADLATRVRLDERLLDYITHLVFATRDPAAHAPDLVPYIRHGASPRASICLAAAARARAFLDGRAYATPQDIKAVAPDVLRHRILLTYEAEAENFTAEAAVEAVFAAVPAP